LKLYGPFQTRLGCSYRRNVSFLPITIRTGLVVRFNAGHCCTLFLFRDQERQRCTNSDFTQLTSNIISIGFRFAPSPSKLPDLSFIGGTRVLLCRNLAPKSVSASGFRTRPSHNIRRLYNRSELYTWMMKPPVKCSVETVFVLVQSSIRIFEYKFDCGFRRRRDRDH
jgi:hypothetical protein